MIEQTYRIDMIPDGAPVVVHVSQYDTAARRLSFELYNGGVAYELPAGAVASIAGTKPDNTSFLYAMTVSGNLVSIDLQQQMALVAGDVPAEIQITGAEGKIGSANFIIRVERGPIDENSVISDTDVPIIVDFVVGGSAGQFFRRTATGGEWVDYIPSGASWGTITGDLADQTDLNNKFSEINNNISQKANTSDVNSALALKANTADVNTALATKADTSAVNTLAGSLAMIESSPATASHAVGSYIVWNGQLYEVTSAISSGETLVVGTNISGTTVGAELTALKAGLTLFKSVRRTVTQNVTTDVWNMNTTFPPKKGYTRVIVGLHSSSQECVVTGWSYNSDGNPQWMVRKFASGPVTDVTYYATLLYMPDSNIWA